MKKVLCLILTLIMLMPSAVVLAEEESIPTSGECLGGLFWEFDNGVLTISGEGEMGDYHVLLGVNHGDAVYRDYPKEWNNFSISVVKIVIEEGVTKVGAYAFTDCKNLESAELKSVEVIGECAFYGTKLNDLVLSDKLTRIENGALANTPFAKKNESIIMNNTLYWVNNSNQKYVVPDGIKTIAPYAFSGNIYEVVLPEGLEVIENSAFRNCSVKTINLPDSIKTIGDYAFYYGRNLDIDKFPESLETIGEYAFGYTKLSCSNLPDSIKYVGIGAFEDTHITEFTMKKGVTYGAYLLCLCDKLTNVIIEEGVEVIPDSFMYWCEGVTNIKLPESLVSIGEYAFHSAGITEINIPENVKYIGGAAFTQTDIREFTMKKGVSYGDGYLGVVSNCPYLTDIIIEDGVEAIPDDFFENSYRIKDVHIPDSVKIIGNYAFANTGITAFKVKKGVSYGKGVVASCKNLVNVTIENGVTEIPQGMFSTCISLEKVVLPKNCIAIGEGAFRACANLKTVVLGDSLEHIGDNAFYQCENLERITIPRNVKVIDKHAFSGCKSLKIVNLSSGLKEIGAGAFYNCKSLEKIVIPYKVTEIKENTFYNCESLESVKMGAIKHIGTDAFKNCKSLTSINLPKSIASVENNPFIGTPFDYDEKIWENGCFYLNNILLEVKTTQAGTVKIKEGTTLIAAYAFRNCTEIERVEIPYGVTAIPFEGFYNCSSLTEVILPDSITEIGKYAFEKCISLKEITIPKGVQQISYAAFKECTMLEHVNLPEGLEVIDSFAFYKNTSLESITIPASVKTIRCYAFGDCTALKDVIYLGVVEDISKSAF